MATNEEKDALTKLDAPLSRRGFMGSFASATFAGLVAPAMLAKEALAQTAPAGRAGNDLVPLPDVPEAVAGQDPVIRMMRDLRRALEKPMNQRRWIMVIDLRKCTGCMGCTIACVAENKLPPTIFYRPVFTETHGKYPNVARRFMARPCMQCDKPPCTEVCPVRATWKREDGIVVIDYDKCIGCGYCIMACPYSARSFDKGYFSIDFEGNVLKPYETLPSHEYGVDRVRSRDSSPVGNARKCHFCIYRIEKGLLPACTVSCMGRATFFGDGNDPKSLVSELIGKPNVMQLKKEMGTGPNVYYLE
ncbi:MAG: 4Fe-4S dicluster domain-containing protein [Sulfuricella sp.]